ncbi:MAG: VCBS repeat-containing protein, partial [Thermoanaerobaculia bacterium]
EIAAEVEDYLGDLDAIDRTVCKIDLIEEVELERRVRLTVKLILDGVDHCGRFLQDRMFYRWHLVNEGDGAARPTVWRISSDELLEGVRVAGERRSFMALDPQLAGIDFHHRWDPKLDMKRYRSELKFGVIQHASGGISAADYDLDGRSDLLFLDGRRCRLYRNQGTTAAGAPSFADVTAAVGLEGLDQAHVGIFADFDNDGDRDLFVGRYLAPSRFYRNDGSDSGGGPRFTDVSAEMGIDVSLPVTSATLLDFDRDGFLDLYVGVNGNAFEALPRLPFFAQNGQPNRLFRNDGGRRFVDVTAATGTGDVGWSLAVAAGDVDGDGWPDLVVANDFGRKSLYRNRGGVVFAEIAKRAGVLDFSGGMGLAFGDYDDDGRVDLYTSNINSNQRWFGEDMTISQYIRNVLRSRWMIADLAEYIELYRLVGKDWVDLGTQIGEGNSLFRNAGPRTAGLRNAGPRTAGLRNEELRKERPPSAPSFGGVTFEEVKDSHADRAGWSWGVAFFDMDNDTDLDLYAANGWISNTPETDL